MIDSLLKLIGDHPYAMAGIIIPAMASIVVALIMHDDINKICHGVRHCYRWLVRCKIQNIHEVVDYPVLTARTGGRYYRCRRCSKPVWVRPLI